MSDNHKLHKAKAVRNDEFYTQFKDIDTEMYYYEYFFNGKVVYCNCDNPNTSMFVEYFRKHFRRLGLKKLIATYKRDNEFVYKYTYSCGENGYCEIKTILDGNGDFRSQECIDLLQECDVVVTNPPFSHFKNYIAQLTKYKKKFLILGNMNAITYKEVFPLIKDNKMWLGASVHSGGMDFRLPDDCEEYGENVFIKDGHHYINLSGIRWFTNIEYPHRHSPLVLQCKYDEKKYPKYDNYDAINVDKVQLIPCDYDGVIGVPISFMDKYCPEQFEIIGATESEGKGFSNGLWDETSGAKQPLVNGIKKYKRIFIRRKII